MGSENVQQNCHHNGSTSADSFGGEEEALEPPIRSLSTERRLQVNPTDQDTGNQSIDGKRISEHYQNGNAIPSSPETLAQNPHTISLDEICRLLNVDTSSGLQAGEAKQRLDRDGPNVIREAQSIKPWEILLRQMSNSLTLVLVITMAISFAIDDYIEGAVIAAVILLNIIIGFVQDFRAEQQILSLQALSAPSCKVLRDGQVQTAKAETLVLGDIVQLTVGDVVPADIRLFEGINAAADEALLTGESLPVNKQATITMTEPDLSIGDRLNMCYAASSITAGRATGIVVSAGMNTQVGRIAALLRRQGEKKQHANPAMRVLISIKDGLKSILGLTGTPLQIKLSKFALLLFGLAILLAIIVFSANVWDINGEVLIYGICVAVAVIPESLIAVLTITVAVGTKAMARGNVIVRKLAALEAVGGVNHICSDKTGTLTQGRMIARKAWIPGCTELTVSDTTDPFDPTSGNISRQALSEAQGSDNTADQVDMKTFCEAVALCNVSFVYGPKVKKATETLDSLEEKNERWTAIGEPTEIALHVLAMRFSFDRPSLLDDNARTLQAEHAFDSAIKRMTVVYKDNATGITKGYTKGATEAMVPFLAMSEAEKTNIMAKADDMAAEGLRVLCIAQRHYNAEDVTEASTRSTAEKDLSFLGLVGLYDPPRVETAGSVAKCQKAGIIVHMLTGDHIRTATAIANEVGILPPGLSPSRLDQFVMKAEQFDKLSDDEVDRLETLPLVVARCSPSTKVRMVEALHRRRGFCVMTGDGVNDSPSLKRADVGIAMGLNGSDVAKDASDMILTDDNFASIVKAVEEGRRLFDNIQKFLMHLLISNISQVILLLVGLAFQDADGYSIFPLSPLEILWVNLITSSFLAIGLGLEEASPDIMSRPPHNLRIGVFTRELIIDKMIYGSFMGCLCLVAFVTVAYGPGNGNLGLDCNAGYNPTCDVTFRARATTWATLTNLLLVTAWEVKHFSRSLFQMNPERHSGPWAVFPTIARNKFLLWAVIAGFVIAFPVIYLPVVNREVFKHHGIGWEWGVVFGCLVVYIALVELWKAVKRRFGIGSASEKTGVVEVMGRESEEKREV